MTNLIDLITPTNLDIEREKFFEDKKYNPTFHYIWQDYDTNAIFKYYAKQNLWEAIKNQDHDDIVRSASKLFEVQINLVTLQNAKQIALTTGKKSSGSASEYIDLMKKAFEYFEIKDINVLLSEESGFNVRPKHKEKIILVSKYIHFEFFSMEGEINHELVHVIRDKNGHFNHIKPKNNYLPTEEGLASWCQDNTNDDNGAAQHAIEYIGSSVGLKGSLRNIFECMCDLGMSQELAWKRASRHKFGFVDTVQPGDILKPAMYFANEIKIANLSSDEKLKLFIGKISVNDLSAYPIYKGIWESDKILKYFKF